MQNWIKLFSAAAVTLSGAQAEMKPGSCPDRGQNKPVDTFSSYSMAGLWYEYVWDQSFNMGNEYKCSTWIVLSDEKESGPGQYQVYNNMVYSERELLNEETGEMERDADFIKFKMEWDAATDAGQRARAQYTRKDMEDEETQVPTTIVNFIDTDYHQYAVGSTCHESDGQHEESFFVWTREKQPSMYMRRRARNALLALGQEPESMLKGPLVDCWGVDILM